MNKSTIIPELTLTACALLFMSLGYLIKYKKKMNIIAGYDETQIKDKDGLANWVGGIILILGLCFLLAAFGVFLFPGYETLIISVFAVVIILACIATTLGANQYKTKG